MNKSYGTVRLSAGKLLAALLVLAFLIFLVKCAVDDAAVSQNAATPEAVREFLQGYGWEVAEEPATVKTVVIPAKFSDVYEQYNALQKKQGYDLAKYRTETATSYSFLVLNYLSEGEVYANVLVIGGRVVGGDLCSYAMDGFMVGLDSAPPRS